MNRRMILLALILAASLMPGQTVSKTDAPNGYYEILNEAAFPLVIPFHFHNKKPVMNVKINGQPASLMIDNGFLWDQVWLFGSQLVQDLHLIRRDTHTIGGSGEGDATTAYSTDRITLKFDDVIFYQQPALVSPPSAGFTRMFPGVDGQLCNTFFKHFIVEFDFEENRILLHHPDEFQFTGMGSVINLQRHETGGYSVPLSCVLDDETIYSGQAGIDLGGVHLLKLGLNNAHQVTLPEVVNERVSRGAQGWLTEYQGTVPRVTIGAYTLHQVQVAFGNAQTSMIHPQHLGLVGLPLFMKFRTMFDYFHEKLYLEPNKYF